MSSKKSVLVLMAVFLVPCAWPRALAAPPLDAAQADSVSGRVLSKVAFQPEWQPVVVGSVLPLDSLVQIGAGGKLRLAYFKSRRFAGMQAETWYLTIRGPMLVRVDDTVLRKVHITPAFLDAKNADGQGDAKDQESAGADGFGLRTAWNAMYLIIRQAPRVGRLWSHFAKPPVQDVSLSAHARRLVIRLPEPESMLVADLLPVQVQVVWDAPVSPAGGKRESYVLKLWSDDHPSQTPWAKTATTRYFVSVPSAGSYYAQVESADGSLQSDVRHFVVETPLTNLAAKPGHPRGDPSSGSGMEVLIPPRDFWIEGERGQARVDFQFAFSPEAVPGNMDLCLYAKPGGAERFERRESVVISDDHLTLSLAQGQYGWVLAAHRGCAPGVTAAMIRSVGGSLTVGPLAAVTGDLTFDAIVGRLASQVGNGDRKIIYMRDGLP